MNDQVGIAADRRGEMRVTTEREAEMPRVGRAVIGLRLAAQYRFHDLRQPVVARKAVDQPVEDRGRDDLPQREALVERVEIILQAEELLAARRLMDVVKSGEGRVGKECVCTSRTRASLSH